MDQHKSVSINGRQYDPITGLPMSDATAVDTTTAKPATAATPSRAVHAGNIHTLTQKSRTLRRTSVTPAETKVQTVQARPQPVQSAQIHAIQAHKRPTMQQVIAKSPQVTKFTQQPAAPRQMMDIGPARHHLATKAQAIVDAKNTPEPAKPSQVLKQEIIEKAVQNTTKHTKAPKRGFRHPKVASIITASVALFILGGYLTYLNMPSLSVRVAAAAAGVDASYPNYRPDGYQLSGPVAYNKGQVSMKFAANAGPQGFTIKQTKSSWDSAAVLDNYVTPKAGNDYATYSEHGLTIYTFDGGVAWVNGGVLYTIEGNAPLSSEQIRHLATSFI